MGCCRSKGKGKDKGKDHGGEETEQSDDMDDEMLWNWMPEIGGVPAPSQSVGYECGEPISPKTGRRIKRTHSDNFEGCVTPRR
jgi:hypothetical protein